MFSWQDQSFNKLKSYPVGVGSSTIESISFSNKEFIVDSIINSFYSKIFISLSIPLVSL